MTLSRPLWLVAVCVALAACDGDGITKGELPPGNTEIGRASSAICTRPTYCGEIGFLDCNSGMDGPAYYFRKRDGTIVSACGGFCMVDPEGRCARECPPPQWTCAPRR